MSPTAFPSCYAPHKNHKTGYIIFITQMLQNSAYIFNKMNEIILFSFQREF